MLLYFCVLE